MRGLADILRRLSPRQLLTIGWFGFMAYAWPGYMSFDSAFQLRMSRSGYLIDGHPPFMAALWRFVELFVAGPVGMLLIQVTTFLVGAYLIFRTVMTPRRAAIVASLVLWFPPIAAVMAVIWKDSQMTGFLILGLGLMLSDRRRDHVLALVAILAATLMRHNALVMTGPLMVFGLRWSPSYGWIRNTAIAVIAWAVITFTAQLISKALTDEEQHIWHTSLALCDMAATLRYETAPISDAELAHLAPGVTFRVHDVQKYIQDADLSHDFVNTLWKTTYKIFELPRTQAERDAVTAAWKKIVLGHLHAYTVYRWEIVRRLIGLEDDDGGSPVYNWFADIQDPYYSASKVDHDAAPARLQDLLRKEIHVVGVTPIFGVIVYVVLSILLLPFALFERRAMAVLASGIASELVLVIIAPTTDWRYSSWLMAAVVFAVVILVARRIKR